MKKRIICVMLCIAIIIPSLSASSVFAAGMQVYGIDVSAWQGSVIDWNSVKTEKDFVILRAGYTSGKDLYFEQNYIGAKAAGLDVGVYMYSYAQSVADAENDADSMISWLQGKQLEYPIYYDVENSSQTPLGKAAITQITLAFLNKVSAAGYYCGVYANTNWFTNYIDKAQIVNAGYEIWQAAWTTSGTASSDKSSICGAWQYYSKGAVSGISGNVDLDVCYKDYPTIIKALGLNGWNENPCLPCFSVTAESLNMREGPSTSYPILTSISLDTKVFVKTVSGGWANISYGGFDGWVSMSYLSFVSYEHSFAITAVPSTCTAPAIITHTCSICGYSYFDEIPSSGHSYNSIVTPPTCTADGYTTFICAACGDTYTEPGEPMTGHSYTSVDSGGYRTYTCIACGDAYSEPIYTLGDIYIDGNINGKDSNVLNQLISGRFSPTAEIFDISDIVTDGLLNGKDSNRLRQYINGTVPTLNG